MLPPCTVSLRTAIHLLPRVTILTALVFPFLATITANITRYLAIPASDDVILAPSTWIYATTKGYI